MLDVQSVLADVTSRVAELSIKPSLKQSFYALILKYSISTFTTEEISLHQSSTTLRMIEYLSQGIYNLRISSPNGGKAGSSLVFQSQESLGGSRPGTAKGRGESGNIDGMVISGTDDETSAIISLLDTIMETCLFAWNQVSALLDIVYKQQQGSESSGESFNGQDTTATTIRLFSNASISYLFNIAALNTAILRALSNDETDRKRLLHANVVEVTVKGLRLYEKNSCLLQLVAKFNDLKQPSIAAKIPSASQRGSKKRAVRILKSQLSGILDKALPSLIQLIGMIRNISLDKSGRNSLSQQNIASKMCLLLSTYRNQPEVILNIARVLAKLSLYDTFRSQISSNKKYIELLINVVHHEANTCRSIMDEANQDDDDDEEEDDEEDEQASWPAWHTWPVISRIAFTLGNLTTTNETNR